MNKWDERFMQMAELVATWSSCFQDTRHVGAVIVKNKRILTTGYNGAPSGVKSCKEKGECMRKIKNIPSGSNQEICYAVHAEQNAIIQAARQSLNLENAVIYTTHQPCAICAKMIINSGIRKVVYKYGYPDTFSLELFKEAGVEIWQYKE